jgi:phosphoglycerate dehydrogenase-like enzyme
MSFSPTDPNRPIHVVVAHDFTDTQLDQLRAVSPRLKIERHFPHVPDKVWAEAEVLYTINVFPNPEQAPRLRWVQMHMAGLDWMIKQPIMQAQDVEITTASGIHAVPMAEFCLMMMLAFAYRLPEMQRDQAAGKWGERLRGTPLRGRTLGIVGYGSIGRELGRMADALGMTVLAAKRDAMSTEETTSYTEDGTGDPAGEIPRRIYPFQAVPMMVSECDFVVVTAPLTNETRSMINDAVFSAMKKTAVLVNVGRGAVIDEPALISALSAGKIAGAALDVFTEEPLPSGSPLWNMDNVIITPHISGEPVDHPQRVLTLFAENLRRYVDNRPLMNVYRRDLGY